MFSADPGLFPPPWGQPPVIQDHQINLGQGAEVPPEAAVAVPQTDGAGTDSVRSVPDDRPDARGRTPRNLGRLTPGRCIVIRG